MSTTITGELDQPPPILLEAVGVSAGYGSQPVIRDVDLSVRAGEIVALLGPNGAGKTSTLLAVAGALQVLGGEVRCLGMADRSPLHKRARRGLSFVTEERSVFAQMTVRDNLRVAGVEPERVVEMFPELENLLGRRAGLLSGGEQQMLTLGRALCRDPRLLLADELSLGLAPLVADRLLTAVRKAAGRGVGVLLVEQHRQKALAIADRALLMRRGRVVLSGTAAELQGRTSDIEEFYMAGSRNGPQPDEDVGGAAS